MKVPSALRYRSLAGPVYHAHVVAKRPDGRLDLRLVWPGSTRGFVLTRIAIDNDAAAPRGTCFRESADAAAQA